ncbi:RlpA-like double-psi beta-barrel-protein domain-containing protein-containing protein [Cokeromyces recurvatus]|uniref:RlpA-like double-psi beta-barrel-protein domain-containing protein-containing protein n=1 Tax=Cokeromyces recurvatus TaxID=90255 RepID=UPI00221E6F2E|nr:RlpA-like double-psi beta-barrel-protein domain-containing protein-containing protein [Cokeromyces recurvatus]KAI7898881.1 RlpA-like double-psi beta-barrel-protein domain-containing protein-containing protein [Cokeromyces recurvatus]
MKSTCSISLLSFLAFIIFFMSTLSQAAPIEARGSMSGDATYYDVGLGSCGETNSNDDMVVALSSELMGGSGSSYCGKTINVKGSSGSVSVTVVDTCPGCGKEDVDLSPSAFKKLGELGEGRISVTWSI